MGDLTNAADRDATPHITEAVFERLFHALDRLNAVIEAQAQLQQQLATLMRVEDEHIRMAEARYKLIDQFIDPAMNVQGVLKQIVAGQQRLQAAVEQEASATRTALSLHMATEAPAPAPAPQLRQREHGRA